MSHTDRQLDDAIRLVPVPAELAGRLAPEALFDDAAIDRALGGVALPFDLADRVRAAMITVAVPEGVRRPVPRSGAFDLAFEMAHGEAPFVDPSADPILATDRPPLTVRTDGFDSLAGREGRRAGSLRGRPRVEEILAAMPPPPALTTAGDPAVRLGLHAVRSGRTAAGAATVFLEVAVHAVGSVATDGDPPAGMPGGGCRFIVIDPSAPAGPDGPTFGRTALDATAIRRDLIRQVTGHDTLVARQCRLEVRFDPAAVARYRLVGHRQTAVDSLAPGLPPALDLHVGETARAVYEVVPRQPGVGGLATASLTWRSLDGGDATLESADHDSGDRGSSLPSPHGCEILLATGIGEVIADSPHLQRPRTLLADLQAIAAEWRQRGDATPFGSVLVEFLERRGADQRISR